jgi:Tol biopolymer transport system component/imidazolonepropionase-like amidohydrolase
MKRTLSAALLTGSLIAAVLALARPLGGQQPPMVHVTLHEGTNLAAALSPDGRTLAIDLLGTLWTLPASGGTARAITDIWLDVRQPAWSPDGTRIAFQGYRGGTWQIWSVKADGTDPKAMTSGPYDDREPQWSPDGTRIAFSSDRSGNYDVWVLTVATGAVARVSASGANEFMPSWSRDGREIAYASDRREKPGIYTIAADGSGTERQIGSARGALAGPAVRPDGSLVAFNAIDGGESRLLVGDRNIADADEDVFPFRPQWISNDDLLYTADGKIKRRRASGGAAQTIEFTAEVSFARPPFTPKRPPLDITGTQPVRGIMHPTVSPDGTRVVFAALGDLWMMTAGSTPQRLTNDPFVETEPSWSPDGRLLVFSSDRGGSMDLWLRDMQTGVERRLTDQPGSEGSAAWSPDGSRIAFVDADDQIAIASNFARPDRKTEITVIHDRLNEPGRPSWSPDGRYLVTSALKTYSSRFREGTNQVLRISLEGRPDTWLEPQPNTSIGMREDYGPVWSPDGKMMAAVVNGRPAVWPIGRDGEPTGAVRELTTELAASPTWTADSRHVMYQSEDHIAVVDTTNGRVQRFEPHLTWTPAHGAANGSTLVVHAGRLWDGRAADPQTDMDVVIDGNRIARVEKHRAELHTGRVVDASNETVIPGLIEIHSHLRKLYGEVLGRIWLSWGITTVRNPAANGYEAAEEREALGSGRRIGPRLVSTGEPIDGVRVYYPGGAAVSSDEQVAQWMAHAQSLRFDLIKTYVRLPDLIQKRVIEEAHRLGLPVTSHEMYPAVAYGADGVEHIKGTSRRGYSPKVSQLNRTYRDVVDILAASKMTITPTVGIQGGFQLQTLRDASWIDDPRIQKLYPESASRAGRALTRQPASPDDIERRAKMIRPLERTVFNVVRAGGRVTAGTDAPINPYGLSLLAEIEHYVSGGLTPVEALRTATSVSAEAMGAGADIGAIESGHLADLVVIDGNPLTNIKDLRRVRRVVKDGRVYDLDALLQSPATTPKSQ